MLDEDVPPSPRPIQGPLSNSPGRFILQHFDVADNDVTMLIYPHNQDARQPADTSWFPPAVVVDMFYGYAAVSRWGNQECTDAIRSSVGQLYYEHGNEDGGRLSRDKGVQVGEGANRAARKSRRKPNPFHETMDLVAFLWSRSRPGDPERPSSTQEEDRSREKVAAWLQTQ